MSKLSGVFLGIGKRKIHSCQRWSSYYYNVELSQSAFGKISFEIQTYLSGPAGPVVIRKNKLYTISELDDDKASRSFWIFDIVLCYYCQCTVVFEYCTHPQMNCSRESTPLHGPQPPRYIAPPPVLRSSEELAVATTP